MAAASESLTPCAVCGVEKPRSEFSSGQLKKKAHSRKCMDCLIAQETQQEAPAPASSSSSTPEDEGKEDGEAAGGKKKRKKRKKKKKSSGPGVTVRGVNLAPKIPGQSTPPRIPVSKFYPAAAAAAAAEGEAEAEGAKFPEGEIMEHPGDFNTYRITSEEKRAAERLLESGLYQDVREASEVHRQVRQDAQRWLKPGLTLTEIAERIEAGTKALLPADGLKRGWGFPTGLSINHCAAHFSPNKGDTNVLGERDVMKVDFGVHVNGRIIDSAFTVCFDPTFDNLLAAAKAATETGIREAGIDVRLGELGALIQETMESYEVEIDGKVYPVKPIYDLNGHSIGPYKIHAGKTVPIVARNDPTKMEEGELFAIETFASTGRGRVHEDMETSHYMIVPENLHLAGRVRSKKGRDLLNYIKNRFDTLPFCRRWLDEDQDNYLLALRGLIQQDIVREYPPLCDIRGSYTAQYEHTVLLRPTCKEVLSRGQDY